MPVCLLRSSDMLQPDKKSINSDGLKCGECSLTALKNRSQEDFEIDFFERILTRNRAFPEVLAHLGELFAGKGWHRRALQVDLRLATLRPCSALIHYNIACDYAQIGEYCSSVQFLKRAIELGYIDFEHLLEDPDLREVRETDEFLQMLKEILPSTVRSAET